MPRITAFHSVNEIAKPADKRVYHDNSTCPPGRDIPREVRRPGTGGYGRCHQCRDRNEQGM
jgi:hypothetical protein